jgi:ABC-2 type transport system permease protein
MRYLFLLMTPRLLGVKNVVLRKGTGKRRRMLLTLPLAAGFCALMFVLSCRVLGYFRSAEEIGDLLSRNLLFMVLLTFFGLLIFSHIITSLSNLYLSKDLELCHSLPVPIEELFLSRTAHTLADGSWMLLIFGLPVYLAYGYVYRPGWEFYLSLLHLNIAMILIAGGAGIMVTMVLVYIFPARRTRDIIFLLSVIMVIVLYLLFRMLRPERLVNPDAFFTVAQYLGAMGASQSPYLPSSWAAKILWHDLNGMAAGTGFEIALTWFTAATALVVNVWLARWTYFSGMSKSQEARGRLRRGAKALDLFVRAVEKPFRPDVGAVIAKDVRMFFRDNTQWSQLLLLAALVAVYLYNFSVLPLEKSFVRLDFLQNTLAFLNMGLAAFVLSAVSARFVFTAVSWEGEAYWILASSPLSLKRYLWGKFVFFLVPLLILAEVLIVSTNLLLGVTPFMMWLSTITIAFLSTGIVALAVGLGAVYPDFKHQNIAQVATGFGGLTFMMVSALFTAAVIILEAGPVYLLFRAGVYGHGISPALWAGMFGCFGVCAALSAAAVIKPMQMGVKALENQ